VINGLVEIVKRTRVLVHALKGLAEELTIFVGTASVLAAAMYGLYHFIHS
jgi:hypothetical protein